MAGRRGRRVRLRHSAWRRVPAAGRGSLGATSSITAAIALLHQWCGAPAPVAGVGLFPSGRPERAYERVVIWAVALAGFLLPLIGAASLADISSDGGPSLRQPDAGPVPGPLRAVPGAAGRTDGTPRRQIRWLLFGIAASVSLWIPAGALWQLADPDSTAASAASELLSGLAEVTTLGSVLGALFYTGVFGIDEAQPAGSRCRAVGRTAEDRHGR